MDRDHGPARDTASMSDDLLPFTCPRCRSEVAEPYYGPCESCRSTLRATLGAEARDVEAVAYEPKMNVTPNAVATKD
jgi:hypothetical protein